MVVLASVFQFGSHKHHKSSTKGHESKRKNKRTAKPMKALSAFFFRHVDLPRHGKPCWLHSLCSPAPFGRSGIKWPELSLWSGSCLELWDAAHPFTLSQVTQHYIQLSFGVWLCVAKPKSPSWIVWLTLNLAFDKLSQNAKIQMVLEVFLCNASNSFGKCVPQSSRLPSYLCASLSSPCWSPLFVCDQTCIWGKTQRRPLSSYHTTNLNLPCQKRPPYAKHELS